MGRGKTEEITSEDLLPGGFIYTVRRRESMSQANKVFCIINLK